MSESRSRSVQARIERQVTKFGVMIEKHPLAFLFAGFGLFMFWIGSVLVQTTLPAQSIFGTGLTGGSLIGIVVIALIFAGMWYVWKRENKMRHRRKN